MAARAHNLTLPGLPLESMLGSLLRNFLFDTTTPSLTPMNANFGILPDLPERVRGKRDRKLAKAARASAEMATWLSTPEVRDLLAATAT